eukprot:95180-Rhodomonas_salina.1
MGAEGLGYYLVLLATDHPAACYLSPYCLLSTSLLRAAYLPTTGCLPSYCFPASLLLTTLSTASLSLYCLLHISLLLATYLPTAPYCLPPVTLRALYGKPGTDVGYGGTRTRGP